MSILTVRSRLILTFDTRWYEKKYMGHSCADAVGDMRIRLNGSGIQTWTPVLLGHRRCRTGRVRSRASSPSRAKKPPSSPDHSRSGAVEQMAAPRWTSLSNWSVNASVCCLLCNAPFAPFVLSLFCARAHQKKHARTYARHLTSGNATSQCAGEHVK